MRKTWLILKREYVTRVRTKAFIFTTILLPILTIGYFVFVVAIATRQTGHPLKIAILDEAGGLATSISERLNERRATGQPVFQRLNEKSSLGQPAFQILRTLEPPRPNAKLRDELGAQVRQGQLDGYLLVPKGALEDQAAEFHTKNPGDFSLTVPIRRAISDAVIARRLNDRGIRIGDVSKVVRGVDIKFVKVTKQGEVEEKGQTFLTAFVMIMVLYMTLIIYGVSTMRSVLEEKTTRIIEILVSSVKPLDLLTGKILGVAAVALTQYLIWTFSGGLLATYGVTMAAAFKPGVSISGFHLPLAWLVYLVLFFLGGYFLYAALYAAVGAMVSNEQDAQQLQIPVTLPIVLSVVLFNIVLRDPNSRLSIVLSLIPFLSPILMVFRIALQTPPFWQIALSLALLALTTVGVVFFSAKIYRVGVLMYGKRPSLVEVVRWLRYS